MTGHRWTLYRPLLGATLTLLFSFSVLNSPAARPGDVDQTFGPDRSGKAGTDFGGNDVAESVAIQEDGKIVAAGSTCDGSTRSVCRFALARYNEDGSKDDGGVHDTSPGDSFGTDGRVETDIAPGQPQNDSDRILALVIQPDGKLLVAGESCGIGHEAPCDFALARYEVDGSLDKTFGANGRVLTDFGYQEGLRALALQGDGKIVAAGSATRYGQTGHIWATARYLPNGVLDASFMPSRLTENNRPGINTEFFGYFAYANSVAIQQPGGEVVVTGTTNGNEGLGLVRYLPDGSRTLKVDHQGFARASDIVIKDGRVLVSGRKAGNLAVAGLGLDGVLDPGFGNGGVSSVDLGGNDEFAKAIALQADSRILVAGNGGSGFALARFNRNGSLDDGGPNDSTPGDVFGGSPPGASSAPAGSGSDLKDLAIDAACRPVAAGTADENFVVVRYKNESPGCGADLALRITDAPDPVETGKELTYTIDLRNNGPQQSRGVTVETQLSPGVTVKSVSTAAGTCGTEGTEVTCRLGNQPSQTTTAITISVVPTGPGEISAHALATSSSPETEPSDNEAVANTTVIQPPNGNASILPEISSIEPSCGPTEGGTAVAISGKGLTQATGVRFGDKAAAFYPDPHKPDTKITAVTPPSPSGSVRLEVTTAAGSVTAPQGFVLPCPAAPLTPAPASGTATSGGLSSSISSPPLTGTPTGTTGGAQPTPKLAPGPSSGFSAAPSPATGSAPVVSTAPAESSSVFGGHLASQPSAAAQPGALLAEEDAPGAATKYAMVAGHYGLQQHISMAIGLLILSACAIHLVSGNGMRRQAPRAASAAAPAGAR